MQSAVCLLLAVGVIFALEDSYRLQIDKDRKEKQEFLRSEKSPLRLIGRFTVGEGDSKIGSDPADEFQLPSRAPGQLGTVHRQGGNISFEPAPGASMSHNGKPASGRFPLQAVASPKPSDRVTAGDLPRGVAHCFQNTGNVDAKFLVVATPAGLEKFFEEAFYPAGDRSAALPPMTEEFLPRLLAAASKCGLELVPPPSE